MTAFHRQKTIHVAAQKRRIHNIVPWIRNPLQGVDKAHLVFAQRHEASTLELFFDLFFVANLATFTAYHYIVDHSSLFAYIGFFAIIWASWFLTVLHDVRFENDSIYSRACKTVNMVTFVGFALVGSAFAPGTSRGDNTNFRVLCYTLVMSRALFAVQYLVVGVFVFRARRTDLYLPVVLNTAIYILAIGAYAGMIPQFAEWKPVDETNGIYSAWWVVMAFECVATIAVSCFWRMMSFKKTHLVERMGLLTLIVIGEGAIGVTKTISRMMGKGGLDPEGCGLVLCIVLILVGTWMLYFDNQPHGHFGTIRQQIWSALHFPLHLAIVGLVEGAQQIALARYLTNSINDFGTTLANFCLTNHLDGDALARNLNTAVKHLQLDYKVASSIYMPDIKTTITKIGSTPGICSAANTINGTSPSDLPSDLIHLASLVSQALYSSMGMSVPAGRNVLEVMLESWKLVYRYFWAAFLLLTVCFLIVTVMIRTTKRDAFEYFATIDRVAVVAIGAMMLGLSASHETMYSLMETPVILPVAVVLIFLIVVFDRFGAWFANRRNRASGDQLIGGEEDSHSHSQGHGHGLKEHGADGSEADKQSLMVSVDAVVPTPDEERAEPQHYHHPAETYAMQTYSDAGPGSPPRPSHASAPHGTRPISTSSAPHGYTAQEYAPQEYAPHGYAPSGYAPVGNSQYVGAGY